MGDAAYDVSVIIHAADAADHLAGCVKAALDQEGVSVHVVIVDDASSDETPSLGSRICASHPDVSMVTRLEEGHRTLAWLDGVAAAGSPFALLLEAEDRLRRDVLATVVDLAVERDADAVIARRESPVTMRGQLFETRTIRRALAELGDVDLRPAEDEAILFMVDVLARNVLNLEDLEVAEVAVPEEPETFTPEELAERCRARDAVETVADYLDRSEGWRDRRRDWERFVHELVDRAVEPFPRAVEPVDWGAAASVLLEGWGAPLVATALAEREVGERAIAARALGASDRLSSRPSKVRRLLLCVGARVPKEAVRRSFEVLSAKVDELVLVADERTALPGDLYQLVSLPLDGGVLARCQALEAAIERSDPDAVVLFAGQPQSFWDGLVPRALGLPVGLLTDWDEALGEDSMTFDPTTLVARADDATFATAIALPGGTDATPLKPLNVRVTTLDGLVSQLTLGEPRPQELRERLFAIRLVESARSLVSSEDRATARVHELEESVEALKLVVSARDSSIAELRKATSKTERPSPDAVEEPRRPWFKDRRRRS